jgi:hypothetical protein
MVRNGDAHKAIWLSELSWNALPPESDLPPVYGRVTPEQQGRYTALAYARMQREWPWLGVGFYWFFKQADDRERDINPQYYFRMVEPDFSLLPVYHALKAQANQPPVMYRGWHEAAHWAVVYQGRWQAARQPEATFNDAIRSEQAGDSLSFTFEGTSLSLATAGIGGGHLQFQVDQAEPGKIDLSNSASPIVPLADKLPQGRHSVKIEVITGPVTIDGFIVKDRPTLAFNQAGSAIMVLATLAGLWVIWQRRSEKSATT